jgi:hypothetical protein
LVIFMVCSLQTQRITYFSTKQPPQG